MLGGVAFLVALFGGTYLGVKSSNDKQAVSKAQKEYEDAFKKEDEARKAWEASVINKKLEIELEDRLYNGDEELLQELRDTWNDYYEGNQFATCYIPTGKMRDFRGAETGVFGAVTNLNGLRMLMANRGYLTELDAIMGIDLYAAANTRAEEARYSLALKNFVRAIDRKLRDHGKCEPMYIGYATEYYSIYSQKRMFGNVKWRPMLQALCIKGS